jgi:hypothetical protein
MPVGNRTVRSTVEVPEQRWATAGGGHRGKATDQGEHRAGDRAPDSEPDQRIGNRYNRYHETILEITRLLSIFRIDLLFSDGMNAG